MSSQLHWWWCTCFTSLHQIIHISLLLFHVLLSGNKFFLWGGNVRRTTQFSTSLTRESIQQSISEGRDDELSTSDVKLPLTLPQPICNWWGQSAPIGPFQITSFHLSWHNFGPEAYLYAIIWEFVLALNTYLPQMKRTFFFEMLKKVAKIDDIAEMIHSSRWESALALTE